MKYFKVVMVIVLCFTMILIGPVVCRGVVQYQTLNTDDHIENTIRALQNQKDYLKIDYVSETFIQAIVAIEDHRFYRHNGLDYIAITRAALENFKSGKIISGGSTITQQLSKNLFLTFDKTYERKITEILIARKLESFLNKEEILELYMNVIYFGENQYGIENASQHYFGKSALTLTDSEAVLLAGLPQAPNVYALNKHMEKAISRSHQVLSAMMASEVLKPNESTIIRYEILNLRSLQ